MQVTINKELKNLIPPLTSEEYNQLEQNILQDGCRDPLVVWFDASKIPNKLYCKYCYKKVEWTTEEDYYHCQECDSNFAEIEYTIIDGHNRFEICTKHKIPFKTVTEDFDNIDQAKIFIIDLQLGRRNLSDYPRIELIKHKKQILLKIGKENLKTNIGGSHVGLSITDKGTKHNTREEIAKDLKISTGKLAQAEVIMKKAPEEVKEKLRKGDITINEAYTKIKKDEKKQQKQSEKNERDKKISKIIEDVTEVNLEELKIGWYLLGKQYLYYGNNKDDNFYNFLPDCSLGFADPPYNAGVDKWDVGFKWEQDKYQDKCDVMLVTPGGWNAFNFYNETKMNYIWEMCCWIKNGMTHGKCGYANFIKVSVFGKKKPKIEQDLFTITIKTSETTDTDHRGRKPYEFMSELINRFSNENDNIFDLFAGSGTTLFMSEKLNRVSYNAELDKQYCLEIIAKGISNGMQLKQL